MKSSLWDTESLFQMLKKSGGKNIKLGYGGIREVEFIVQTYQLLFGGKDKGLRIANTVKALAKLRKLGFLMEEDYDNLLEAYVFLRNLENRVQISFGLQTHLLPKDNIQLSILARKMGITGNSKKESSEKLQFEFNRHTRFVGGLFAGLFADEKKREAVKNYGKRAEGRVV